jgi:hypothetical protein
MAKKRAKTKSLRTDYDVGPPFNLFTWRASIPLCDDLWLGMQAQNIAIVDSVIRHFEQQALQHYYANDRFSMEHLAPLSAMSQMWVFALYEFLRTWLQRASSAPSPFGGITIAPTRSVAARSGSSSKCEYRAVVAG